MRGVAHLLVFFFLLLSLSTPFSPSLFFTHPLPV